MDTTLAFSRNHSQLKQHKTMFQSRKQEKHRATPALARGFVDIGNARHLRQQPIRALGFDAIVRNYSQNTETISIAILK
jgi:hypothetical protein